MHLELRGQTTCRPRSCPRRAWRPIEAHVICRATAQARPIESADTSPREPSDVSPSQRSAGLVPRLRSAERLTSGGDEATAPRPIAPPCAETQPPLQLAPPANDARGARRSGEMPALATGAASLAIVVGLFFVVVWAVRRGLPKGAGLLPPDALEVLGRAPLVGKQQVHLVRCGNKLLLDLRLRPVGADIDRNHGPCGSRAAQRALPVARSQPVRPVSRRCSNSSRPAREGGATTPVRRAASPTSPRWSRTSLMPEDRWPDMRSMNHNSAIVPARPFSGHAWLRYWPSACAPWQCREYMPSISHRPRRPSPRLPNRLPPKSPSCPPKRTRSRPLKPQPNHRPRHRSSCPVDSVRSKIGPAPRASRRRYR